MKEKSFNEPNSIVGIDPKSVLRGLINKSFVLPKRSEIAEYFLFLRGANLSIHLDSISNISNLNKSLSKITECRILLSHKVNKNYKLISDI